jgi:hypothetical protein
MIGLFIGFAVSVISCKSDTGSILKGGGSEKPIVLVAGYSGINGTNHIAKFWMDGQETALTNGTTDAMANAICVSGSDVYIAGTETIANYESPVYWKNNTEVKLPIKSAYGQANAICVSGNDMYIAGTDSISAVYWKNGVETILDVTEKGSSATAICVSGNDLYVAGKDSYNAVYWKNGNIVQLTSYSVPTQNEKVSGISVIEGKVYVVGYIYYAGGAFPNLNYWANGVATDLNTGYDLSSPHSNYGEIFSTCASGNDVYIAGMVETTNQMINHAVYWKNGVETVLTCSEANSLANCISISGNDVYVAGHVYDNGPKSAAYWKNGVEVKLTDGTTETVATSIFIR